MSKTLYTDINLFDGITNGIQRNNWMLVNNDSGKIEAIDNTKQKPNSDNIVELKNKYVMPGLVNAHTHFTWDADISSGGTELNEVATIIRSEKNLYDLIKSGVTYVRECGGAYGDDIELSKLERNGKLKYSPKILASGKAMSMTGGHGDLPNIGYLVDSTDEMRKLIRTNFKRGAKCTKVMATGGIMTRKDYMNQPQFTVDEIKTAVRETHAKHTVVGAHAEGNPGIYNAIKAGVDSIEHGYYINDEEIKMMVEKNTYLTPTLVAAWGVEKGKDSLPSWEYKKLHDALSSLTANIHNAYSKGVKLTLGTDAGSTKSYFDQTPEEFQFLVEKEGLSNFDALSTSRHSAEMMKLKDYGTLTKNKYADFLVLDYDPLKNVKAVQQKDKSVYKDGQKIF